MAKHEPPEPDHEAAPQPATIAEWWAEVARRLALVDAMDA